MRDFKNKVAVVTGAASGIGRAMAEVFATAGMKVVLSDIEANALAQATQTLRDTGADVHAVVTDVAKPEQVEQLAQETLQKYAAVHVLCNNAGVGAGSTPSWTSTLNDWNWILGVNLMGVVHGLRTFLPIMIAQDTEAHIVNTASMAGLAAGGSALYSVTKSGVVSLSEAVYRELLQGSLKPRISVLCPGYVDTNIVDSHRNRPGDLANATEPTAPPVAAVMREWLVEQLKEGLSPRAVAEQVLAAIRAERFYILTHPQLNNFIEQRMRDIVDGKNPTLLPPPGAASLMQKLAKLGGR